MEQTVTDSTESIVSIAQILLRKERDKGKEITPLLIAQKLDTAAAMDLEAVFNRQAAISELVRRFSHWVGKESTLKNIFDHFDWLDAQRKNDWRYWGRLQRYLERRLSIEVVDALDRSTDGILELLEDPLRPGSWDRRGLVVGHVQSGKTSSYSALICNNYTPANPDGTVDCGKALKIAAQFAQSRELWSHLVAAGELPAEATFLREVPHISFVTGGDVPYLRARAETLSRWPLFHGLEYTEDAAEIGEWIPLVMDGRDPAAPVAATRMMRGTDVNFGALTRSLVTWIDETSGFAIELGREVRGITRADGGWLLEIKHLATGDERTVHAKFVFIGAGGYSLTLLEKSGVPEARGYGAFPVSGQWLRCTNRDVIARHHAKVYGQAQVGAPPMSVPHLDTRWIGDEQELLFGPYAGFTTCFHKEGSIFDLLRSIGIHNVRAVLSAGLENLDLTKYLVGQAMLSTDERVDILRRFCPSARDEDWEVRL